MFIPVMWPSTNDIVSLKYHVTLMSVTLFFSSNFLWDSQRKVLMHISFIINLKISTWFSILFHNLISYYFHFSFIHFYCLLHSTVIHSIHNIQSCLVFQLFYDRIRKYYISKPRTPMWQGKALNSDYLIKNESGGQ